MKTMLPRKVYISFAQKMNFQFQSAKKGLLRKVPKRFFSSSSGKNMVKNGNCNLHSE
jgi:hypothetical protein